jgi:hypothetical protein
MVGGVARLLVLLIFELAIVHDPADGRPVVGRDFDEVEVGFAGFGERGIDSEDAQLRPIGANDTDGRNANLLVDTSLLIRRWDRETLSDGTMNGRPSLANNAREATPRNAKSRASLPHQATGDVQEYPLRCLYKPSQVLLPQRVSIFPGGGRNVKARGMG